jgi:hypothetical protein
MLTCQTYDVLIICFFLVFYDCWFSCNMVEAFKRVDPFVISFVWSVIELLCFNLRCVHRIYSFSCLENRSIHPPHGTIIDCWAWIIDHHNLVLYDDNPSKVIITISMMPQAWVMMVLLSTCFMLHWSSFTLLQPCGCLKRWGHSKGNACSIKC